LQRRGIGNEMESQKRDVVVVGGGPAGYVAAIRAAQLGAKVLLVEKFELGGTCLYTGCIPTKTWLKAAEVLETVRKAKRYGVIARDVSFDFKALLNYTNMVVKTILSGLKTLLNANGVEIINGYGRLNSASEVEVSTSTGTHLFEAGRIILAPGASPSFPFIPGMHESGIITTNQVFKLNDIPESMAIIGAGVAGAEMANIFAVLGTKVSLIEVKPHIVPTEDEEMGRVLERIIKKAGVRIYTDANIERIEEDAEYKTVVLKTKEGEKKLPVKQVFVTAGRRPNTPEMGLEALGIQLEKNAIVVNDRMETTVPGIYAAGDAVGGIMLAHVAYREAEVAAENALGKPSAMDYRAIPRCIFTGTEMSAVGLTEKRARDDGYDITIGRFPLTASSKALILGERDGLIKIIADAASGEILGIHMVAPHATELIAEATAIMNAKGGIKDIISTIHAHPTLHESVHEAALDVLGMGIHIPPKKG
jgi:dihydrolipoamide dehydrogenase